jgi:hypothetical protein
MTTMRRDQLRLPDVLVDAAFDITGRGVAIAFTGPIDGLAFGRNILVRVTPLGGEDAFEAVGTLELGRRTNPDREFKAMLLRDCTKEAVPAGSRLTFLAMEGPLASRRRR